MNASFVTSVHILVLSFDNKTSMEPFYDAEAVKAVDINVYGMSSSQQLIPFIVETSSIQNDDGKTIKLHVTQVIPKLSSNSNLSDTAVQVFFTSPSSQDDNQKILEPTNTGLLKPKRGRAKRPASSNNNKSQKSNQLLTCDVCGKHFVSFTRLESHTKTHTKARPFECPECGKTFTVRYSLICHTRTHTREKPYVCGICKARFSQASSLKTHQIFKHSKDFPYSCEFCGRGFISPGQKHEHYIRSHQIVQEVKVTDASKKRRKNNAKSIESTTSTIMSKC